MDGGTDRIVIPYKRREAFKPFHASGKRWGCLVAHRRAGKTVAVVNRLIKNTLKVTRQFPPPQTAYVGPFLNQSKRVAWEYLKHFSAPVTIGINVQDHTIELINGGKVMLLGSDNLQALRGAYFDDLAIDETGDHRPSAWTSILRPTLSDYNGSALFCGTPRGLNHFWEIYRRAQEDPEWDCWTLRASQTGILPDSELQQAKSDMSEDEYQREYECSFEASHAGAFYSRELREAREQGRIGEFPIDPSRPLNFVADLGYTDACSWWVWQEMPDHIRIVHYYETNGRSIQHYIEWLHGWRSRGFQMGEVYLPHDARAKSLQTGRSIVEQVLQAGITPRIVTNMDIMDGIEAARVMFKHFRFNQSETGDGVACLLAYQRDYDEDRKVYSNRPRHDWSSHGADSLRYLSLVAKLEPQRPSGPEKPLAVPVDASFSLDQLWETGQTSINGRV